MKQSELAGLLPAVFRRVLQPGEPLAAVLQVMAALQAPSEQVLADLDGTFDPYRTPDRFVPFLAGWLDLDDLLAGAPERMDEGELPFLFDAGLGRLRELIAAAAELSRWRGTGHGLVLFLETATGISGFVVEEEVVDETGRPRPFHIRIRAPRDAERYQALLERIVALEKPAYVTYELQFTERKSGAYPAAGTGGQP